MRKRILIFGNGWLANRLSRALTDTQIAKADIRDRQAIRQVLQEVQPSVVINATGKTGRPNVDWCEDHAAETLSSNVAGPLILAQECLARNVFMAHLGSGCVYEGNNGGHGFSETDQPNFDGSLYSRSKRASESALKDLPVLQLRIRMPFDGTPHPRNLITKLVGYRKVISTPNSLTCIDDFLLAAEKLIAARRTGLWNVTNPGSITHDRILSLYRDLVDPAFTYELMSLDTLASKVRAARSNCVLSTKKLECEGIRLPPVEEAMRRALGAYGAGHD